MKYSTGRFFGENLFLSDFYHVDVKLENLLIHEGPVYNTENIAS